MNAPRTPRLLAETKAPASLSPPASDRGSVAFEVGERNQSKSQSWSSLQRPDWANKVTLVSAIQRVNSPEMTLANKD